MKILLHGALGHMGMNVRDAAAEREDALIVAGVDAHCGSADFPLYTDPFAVKEPADVIIDFTLPAACDRLLEYALAQKLPLVLATTGLSPQQEERVKQAARQIPIFRAANFSVGVYVLNRLLAQAARLLPQADVEIVETHHNRKQDAPSGTALALAQTLAQADESHTFVYGRQGRAPRKSGEVGIHALRGGTVAGIHEIDFFLPEETLTLRHEAASRAVFAQGALRAAAFLITQKPGLYGMEDMLGL